MEKIDFSKDVEILRKRFLEVCTKEILEGFEESDLQRFSSDDSYCELFLKHHEGDVEKSLNMVKESFKWRKDFNVQGLNESELSIELLKQGFMYRYHHDIDGNPLLMIIMKIHKRGCKSTEDVKRMIVYFIEKALKESPNQSVSILFDCEGAGVSNCDFQVALFGTNLFLKYYPSALGYGLVYDMPKIFDVVWRIIKPMLPKHLRSKVVFVNKDTINQYVEDTILPTRMGGQDTFEYSYTPGA